MAGGGHRCHNQPDEDAAASGGGDAGGEGLEGGAEWGGKWGRCFEWGEFCGKRSSGSTISRKIASLLINLKYKNCLKSINLYLK